MRSGTSCPSVHPHNFLVIQQQCYLAQARSTEVAARSVWIRLGWHWIERRRILFAYPVEDKLFFIRTAWVLGLYDFRRCFTVW